MKIVVASDEKTSLTDFVTEYLESKHHEVILLGALKEKNEKWAEIGMDAAKMVAKGEVDQGVIFCWSGTGMAIAANRINGARAALCWTSEIAKLARKWDNANMLVMALVNTNEETAREMLDTWFTTTFDEEGLNEVYKLDEL